MQQLRSRTWRSRSQWREICFTINQARRALPYARRVLTDATEAYHEAQWARRKLAFCPPEPERSRLIQQRDQALGRLNRTIDECNALGAEHLDIPSGTIAFRATVDGKHVSLIWRLGESTVEAWHDLPAMVDSDARSRDRSAERRAWSSTVASR